MNEDKVTGAADDTGLAPEVEIPKLTPALQPGDLSDPVVVRYLGYEVKHSNRFNRDQRLYQFQLPEQFGATKFALWAQAQLDLKLGRVMRGAILLMQYLGRDDGDRAQHNWSVRPFKGSSAQLQQLVATNAAGCQIAQNAADMISSQMNGKAESSEDNDDLPF